MEDAKILAGSFRGSKQKLNSNKISYLPEVVKLLFKEIKDDWEEVRGGREGGGAKRNEATRRVDGATSDASGLLKWYLFHT